MLIFGINLPLAEILLMIIIVFVVCLILILMQLQKLQKMSSEEIAELEKMYQEEQKDLEEIKSFESKQSTNIQAFEREIEELEENNETLYLKKLAPDLYKLQNYVIWALKKGLSPEQIKSNLLNKGWKDNALVEMILNDTLKYMGYYKEKKGNVDVPAVKIQESTQIIKPVKIVHIEKTVTAEKAAEKKPRKPRIKKIKQIKKKAKKQQTFGDVESQLKTLESDLEREKKRKTQEHELKTGILSEKKAKKAKQKAAKKPKKQKKEKKPKKKQKPAQKKVSDKTPDTSSDTKVTIEADKGVDLHVKYK